MRILFDHSTPAPLRHHLGEHEVKEAVELGWERFSNGDLLTEAERPGFEVMITADKTFAISRTWRTGRLPWWCSAMRNGPFFAWMSNEWLRR
jgi:hypothetical protein